MKNKEEVNLQKALLLYDKAPTSAYFDTQVKSFFFDDIKKLFDRREKCIRDKEAYITKEK